MIPRPIVLGNLREIITENDIVSKQIEKNFS